MAEEKRKVRCSWFERNGFDSDEPVEHSLLSG